MWDIPDPQNEIDCPAKKLFALRRKVIYLLNH
jgi:hypothetical protein